ncbi:MAG: YtxH domain-containing protein [Smithella sp.]|jgi:gas vesicle protein
MSEKNNDLLKGLFIGGLIGVVLGILYAPKSGKETREDIARKADELLGKAKEEYEKAVEKSKTAYETAVKHLKGLEISAKEKVEEVEGKVSEFTNLGAEAISGNKNRLKKAIDAGVEAYREENKKPV